MRSPGRNRCRQQLPSSAADSLLIAATSQAAASLAVPPHVWRGGASSTASPRLRPSSSTVAMKNGISVSLRATATAKQTSSFPRSSSCMEDAVVAAAPDGGLTEMMRSPLRTRNGSTGCARFQRSSSAPSATLVTVKPPCVLGAIPMPSFSPPPRWSGTARTGQSCRKASSSVSCTRLQQQQCLQITATTMSTMSTAPASIVRSSVSILA
mmetsp:Transcript_40554/g.94206  ORF Transcript_40554/g.94206 Transcript_40554/m.94206 type:complete len:210 (-) Transcript_40554:535-1164(-)